MEGRVENKGTFKYRIIPKNQTKAPTKQTIKVRSRVILRTRRAKESVYLPRNSDIRESRRDNSLGIRRAPKGEDMDESEWRPYEAVFRFRQDKTRRKQNSQEEISTPRNTGTPKGEYRRKRQPENEISIREPGIPYRTTRKIYHGARNATQVKKFVNRQHPRKK
ncbi:hypothetical protein C922_05216 [Plasmodium inui San Antonio 1]|uniref:Uncharacterized protein n=1 Tax=Plasmodium inui San Antonio 1 TaxID=1237626 RepID=W6ZYL7_9APIC|nr:hypothetical protein C922_05216 [Plasmodium inui San Antonio 1]EUD64395.1 hypothetical protein C922_05216 [Plasmodium inui San Antonio 1]